jgi:endonuclease YncB( thermonuclease family)
MARSTERVLSRRRSGPSRSVSPATLTLLALLLPGLCALGSACADARADGFRAHVTRVRDGDTIEVRRTGETIRVRVFGIDCPEHGQPWSSRARQRTADLVGNRDVTIRVKDHDRYGRTVGEVILADGRSLGVELVREGLAWDYHFYSKDPVLARLEAEARAARRGLWADPHPVAPWDFRHGKGGAHGRRGAQGSADPERQRFALSRRRARS